MSFSNYLFFFEDERFSSASGGIADLFPGREKEQLKKKRKEKKHPVASSHACGETRQFAPSPLCDGGGENEKAAAKMRKKKKKGST